MSFGALGKDHCQHIDTEYDAYNNNTNGILPECQEHSNVFTEI